MALETNQIDSLRSLIEGIPYAMLTTQGTDGFPHGRPMVAQDDDGDEFLWFFSDSDTHKVKDILAYPYVNVGYSDQKTQVFVSVLGKVEVVTDPAVLADRWRPSYAKWLPLAIGDPRLVLLKVVMREINYWKPPSGWVGRTLKCKTFDLKPKGKSS